MNRRGFLAIVGGVPVFANHVTSYYCEDRHIDVAPDAFDDYRRAVIVMTSGLAIGYARMVTGFDAASSTFSVEPPFPQLSPSDQCEIWPACTVPKALVA